MKANKDEQIGLLVILKAQKGKEDQVKKFLKEGLDLVNQEPNTESWFAFQIDERTFGIFDTFKNEAGRQEHLSGSVAKALLANASSLLEGFEIKTTIQPVGVLRSHKISGNENKGLLVIVEAKQGKSKEVEDFLKVGEQLVKAEPQTVSWYAIKLADGKYAIFDTFADEAGREAHLHGKIAAALMENAAILLDEFNHTAIQKINIIASK